jgi:hypothetical protein
MNENLMNFKCEYDPGVIKKKRSPIVIFSKDAVLLSAVVICEQQIQLLIL